MGKKARSLLKISSIFFGTVLGAGFASGKELVLFFVRFENRATTGVLVSSLLFCFVGGLVLFRAKELSKKTPRCYLETVFGKTAAGVIFWVMEFFLAASFCVMLSGVGAFFSEHLFLPAWWGILLTDVLCLCLFLKDVRGLSLINTLLVPLLITGMLAVCLPAVFWDVPSRHVEGGADFLPFALFYAGYNMLTAVAVLVPASDLAEDRKTAACGGVLGGAVLGLVAFVCTRALLAEPQILSSALPLLQLAGFGGRGWSALYGAVLYGAMLTTAVSTGFSVTQAFVAHGVGQRRAAVFVCALALPLSFVPFSVLVERLYVGFGAVGVFLLLGILWDGLRCR